MVKKSKPKTWTQSEIKFLANLAPVLSAKEIAEKLDRTPDSIRSKAKKLRIKLEKYGEHRHSAKFSKETVKRVLVLSNEGYSGKEIGEQTGMSRFHANNIRSGRSRWRETINL